MIRRALIALHVAIGISAIGSGQALARDPSGKALGFDTAWEAAAPSVDGASAVRSSGSTAISTTCGGETCGGGTCGLVTG